MIYNITSENRVMDKMIAISGFAGSGKNTIAKIVADKLGFRVVEPTFKDLAKNEGITLEEFQLKAKSDPEIDKKFDIELKKQCTGGDAVVATWLGPWMAPGKPYRVWLDVDLEIRVLRVSKRENETIKQTLEKIKTRDKQNIERYKKVYNIDIRNHDNFNLVIKVVDEPPQEIADKIVYSYLKDVEGRED